MKNIRYIIGLLTIGICINSAFSQDLNGLSSNSLSTTGGQYDIETWVERNKLRAFNENDETLGERFLYEEWKMGSIQTTDSFEVKGVELKYDLLFDELIGKLRGGVMTLRKENINKFIIMDNNTPLSFRSIFYENKILFLQEIYIGNSINLYKKHSVRFEQRDTGNQAYGSGVAYDKYVYKEELFLEKDNKLVPFKASKGSILKVFADKKEEIKGFMKKETINVKEDYDLGLVLEYYESINQ